MAWLNTAPKDKDSKDGRDEKTRLEAIRDAGGDVLYPPTSSCHYLVGLLFDAGPALYGGMGASPLTHSEIRAYQQNTATTLTPWEAREIRRLSSVYLSESQKAEEPDCPQPYQIETTTETKADVSKKVQSAFQLLMRTRPKK